MSKRLKIGLIGAGVFAGYHANKLAAHPRVDFTGVNDPNVDRAENLAKKHNVSVLTLGKLLDTSDAVVVASSASAHGAIAVRALEAGCHCLVEKPLATTAAQAKILVALAAEKKLVLQVGHQERMVLKAIGLDKIEVKPSKIEAVRHSVYSPRGTDTSVTFDLMTHDIDLCTALMGGGPDEVRGQSARVRSNTADMAYAILRYGSAKAFLSASRVAEAGERRMKLTYPSGEVTIDFNSKTVTNSTEFALNANFAEDETAKDSLGAATDVFVRAVLDGTPVMVNPADGAIAVRTAEQIDGGE